MCSRGLTPEEDEHMGDCGEQGAAQAAAHTHARAGGFQADHFVHGCHQFRWVFPFQTETGHGVINTSKTSENRSQAHFGRKEERRGFEPLLA